MYYLKLYLLTIPVFFAIDIIWLGFIAKRFYREKLAEFLNPEVNWVAAGIFYLLFIVGIIFFAVVPAKAKDSLLIAASYGALFGFFTYATYDLTNLATLKNWPLSVVIVDIVWGTILCALVAICSFLISRWIS